MVRKILIVILALVIMLTVSNLEILAANSIMPLAAVTFSGGDGSSGSPYQITTAEQMWAVSQDRTLWDKHFRLMNDIDLGCSASKPWTPIGDSTTPFTGSFQGKKTSSTSDTLIISGLYVNDTSGKSVGLFGVVQAAIVSNSEVLPVANIWVDGYVSGSGNAGGIIGELSCNVTFNTNSRCWVFGCAFFGTVSGGAHTGGIVGSITDAKAGHCFNAGTVIGGADNIGYTYYGTGGIVGYGKSITLGSSETRADYCYNTGDISVTGTSYCGGIIGYDAARGAKNCYNIGEVSGKTAGKYYGYILGFGSTYSDCFYLRSAASEALGDNLNINCNTARFASGTATSADSYKKSKEEFASLASALGGNYTNCAPFGRPILSSNLEMPGNGVRSSSPYRIRSIRTLEALRDAVNAGMCYFTDDDHTCIGMNIDLDMSEIYNSTTGLYWTPIGTEEHPFTGYFAGDLKCKVSGLYTDPNSNYQGLFGYNAGTVTMITVENSTVKGSSYVGTIAAVNKGEILYCSSTAAVSGSSYAGGITADNQGTVTDCFFAGTVSAGSYAGGIAGTNSGTIKYCHNYATPTTSSIVSVNTGTVTGSYYLSSTDSTADLSKGIPKTAAQFTSGEVLWLIQDGRGQSEQKWSESIGTDKYPYLYSIGGTPAVKLIFTTAGEEYGVMYGLSNLDLSRLSLSLPKEPTRANYTFLNWSQTDSADGDIFTADTPVRSTSNIKYLYAVWREKFTGESGTIALSTTYGTAKTLDLSEYMAYASGLTSTAGKFTYTVTSGNTTLQATVSGDTLTVPATANAGSYPLTITASEKNPVATLSLGSYDTKDITLTLTVTVDKANSALTAPTAKTGLTYTGAAQSLVTAGTATGGTLQYSLDGTSYTTAIPTGTNAGTYKVYYKVVGDSNHNGTAAEYLNVEIAKADPTVTAPTAKTGLIYTGAAQSLVTAGTAAGGTLQYSLDGTSYTAAIPTGTDAGTYTVYYKVAGDNNYNGFEPTETITVVIGKADVSVNTAPTAKENLVYSGEEQTLVTAGTASGGEFQYSLTEDGEYSAALPAAVDAGEYDVWYRIVGDDNHNGTQPAKITAAIQKAEPSVTPPVAADLTYNGGEQELVTAGETVGGTLQYSLDGETYSADVPKGTGAGEYTVWYKVVGNSNYNGTDAETVTVEIAKADPEVDPPTAKTLYYTGEQQELVTAGTTSGGSMVYSLDEDGIFSDNIPAAVNVGTYTVWYKVVGDSNYKDTETDSVEVAIEKTKPDFIAPDANDGLTYNGGEQELVTAGKTDHGTVLYSLDGVDWSETVPTAANAGEYEVWYKIVGDGNHGDVIAEEPISVTIGKAARTAPEVDITAETSESSITVTTPDNTSGEYEFSIDGGVTWQDSGEFSCLDEGTEYTVEVRYKETDNYFASESKKESFKTEEKKAETEPEPAETEPEPAETEPEPVETEPETTTPESETTTTEPVVTTTEPVVTTAAPVVTTTEPVVTTTEPVVTTTEPVITTTEPVVTTEPSITVSETTTTEPVPDRDPNAGRVIVDSNSGENAPDVSIDAETSNRLKAEVIAEHLTQEEKEAVANGADLDIILSVEDAGDTVPAEDKQVTEAVITDNSYIMGQYLNIDMLKLINGRQVGKITELSTPISVAVEVPEALRSEGRAYAIIRVHNGEAEILKDQDDAPDTITILTDRFSTYAIVYQDSDKNQATGAALAIVPFIAAAAGMIISKKRR